MIFLILGRGKTGSIVADVAHERGHGVRVIGEEENRDASALTPPLLAQVDAVIDFTTAEAVIHNLRACLSNGANLRWEAPVDGAFGRLIREWHGESS